jgi:hypothetical protein
MLIVEGFKKVGKDYHINNTLKDKGYFPMHYDDFAFKTGDYGLHLPNSFIVGAVLSKLPKEISGEIALNRGIISTWIYSMQDNMGVEKYIKRHYLDDLVKNKAEIVLIIHDNKDVAKRLFNQREKRVADVHDEFTDFDDYWEQYLNYTIKALEIMNVLRGYGIPCSTLRNSEVKNFVPYREVNK